jgi:tetratricopeptide (TPR) repeat protein
MKLIFNFFREVFTPYSNKAVNTDFIQLLLITLILAGSVIYSSHAQKVNGDSLRMLLRTHYSEDTITISRLQGLASYYWRLNPDSSMYYADKSLEIAQKQNNQQFIAIAYFLKGAVFLDRNENSAAREVYAAAIEGFKAVNDYKRHLRAVSNYGISYTNENNYEEARKWLEKGMDMALQAKDLSGQAYITNNLGILADMKGDKQKSIELYLKGLKLNEDAGERQTLGASYANIGTVYSNLEDQQSAIFYTLKARGYYLEFKQHKPLNSAHLNLMYYYIESDSLERVTQFIEALEHPPVPLNSAQQALFLLLKGQFAEKKGVYPEAIPLLNACIEASDKINNPINTHNAKATLSRIYLKTKQYPEALKNSLAALKIALEMDDAVSINLDQKLAAHSYAGIGNIPDAYKMLADYEAGRDTLYTRERFQAVEYITEKYETAKKELVIQQQQASIREQKMGLGAAGVLIALLLVLGGVLYRSNQRKKELNELLNQRNEQLIADNKDLKDRLKNTPKQPLTAETACTLTFTLGGQDKTVLRLCDVLYIKSNGNLAAIHTRDGKIHYDWQRLHHFTALLEPSGFFYQIHRSYLINFLHIKARKASELVMADGSVVRIGSTRTEVDQWLDERIGQVAPVDAV